MKWTPANKAQLEALFPRYGTAALGRHFGVSRSAIAGQAMRQNLHRAPGHTLRIALKRLHDDDGRTIFPTRVFDPEEPLFKPGTHSTKLGAVVAKGDQRGHPIYSLTLEERATCSRDCTEWLTCFGNHMQAAKRYRHGRPLERLAADEVAMLADRHQGGYLLRLHVLGDFYSVDYVHLWASWLQRFPQLHIFGYTAWAPHTPIGAAIHVLRTRLWDRFSVRTSGQHGGLGPGAVVVDSADKAPWGSIVCPAQTGRTRSCATCALCWTQPHRTIAFLRH